ncbi:MAG: bifunctional MaoC family dehydratase N-terminal/OB-fold nucleic acid binding domain-containing protein [Candidatus Binatia bacterium]
MSDSKATLEAEIGRFVGKAIGPPTPAPEPVSEAVVRQWCDALGDRNPVYTDPEVAKASVHKGLVAPPTMIQAWTLDGISMAFPDPSRPKDGQRQLHEVFDKYGYTSVVATDCEQEYARYLHPGERVTSSTVIESISAEKATGLGIGHFIDTRTTFRDERGEVVGSMRFRVLKFKPAQQPAAAVPAAGAPAKPTRLKPPMGHDNGWWWEAAQRGQLPIQRCKSCRTLRHPPRPMCGACRSTEWDSVAASGRGTVYSYVVCHHPQFPGYEYPLVAAVIDLEEGTRLVSNVIGCEPAAVRIGMPVRLSVETLEGGFRLPMFRPAE